MLSIQPRGEDNGDKELGAIGVLARVGHGEETNLVRRVQRCYYRQSRTLLFCIIGHYLVMLLGKVFIIELVSVDGLAPCAITLCEVSSL